MKKKFNRHLAREITEGRKRGTVTTRDGRAVRIVAWDAIGPYPVTGLIYMPDLHVELSWQWTRRGTDVLDNDAFALIIDIKQEKSTVSRLRRGPNKKKRK